MTKPYFTVVLQVYYSDEENSVFDECTMPILLSKFETEQEACNYKDDVLNLIKDTLTK